MDISLVIIFLGLLIFGAHLFSGLFRYIKVPNALLLLIIGVVLGPLLGIVQPEHFGRVGPVFTTITLIFLLFESGTHLKLNELARSIGSAFLLTLFNFWLSATIATFAAYYMIPSLELITASFFGAIVGGISAAVVIPIVKQLKLEEKATTTLVLESALSDVLCLVIGLAILDAMQQGIIEVRHILNQVWQSFLLAALIGHAGGVVWSVLLRRIRIVQHARFTSLAFVFIIYGLTEQLGYNGGIATLLFGVTLGNTHLFRGTYMQKLVGTAELLSTEKKFFGELVFILSTYFFVYVGAHIQFGNPWIYLLALGIVLAIIFVRPLSVKMFVRAKMNMQDLAVMSVLAPRGLVPAILASIPLQLGIAGGEMVQELTYAVVFISILLCSVLTIILHKDPFAIGYLKNLLAGKAMPESNEEETTTSDDSPSKTSDQK